MDLNEALSAKKNELENMQTDIDSLEEQALKLKDNVKRYNDLKEQSSRLKKEKSKKQHEFDTVTGFFKTVDETYLTNIFPLFAKQNAVPEATA